MSDDRMKITDLPMQEIAALLNGTLDHSPENDHGAHICTPDGRLWCDVHWRTKRLHVSISFSGCDVTLSEVTRRGDTGETSITCSTAKSADAIARDIKRRLIPHLIELSGRTTASSVCFLRSYHMSNSMLSKFPAGTELRGDYEIELAAAIEGRRITARAYLEESENAARKLMEQAKAKVAA